MYDADRQNVLDGYRRQALIAKDHAATLEERLAAAERELATANARLAAHGLPPVEAPKPTGEWYSCAVCSTKTDLEWSVARKHTCCRRMVYVGPCCNRALDNSREDVESIMAAAGHAPGCRGPQPERETDHG